MDASEVEDIMRSWLAKNPNYSENEIKNISVHTLKSGIYTDAFKCVIGDIKKSVFFVKCKKKNASDKDVLLEYKILEKLFV